MAAAVETQAVEVTSRSRERLMVGQDHRPIVVGTKVHQKILLAGWRTHWAELVATDIAERIFELLALAGGDRLGRDQVRLAEACTSVADLVAAAVLLAVATVAVVAAVAIASNSFSVDRDSQAAVAAAFGMIFFHQLPQFPIPKPSSLQLAVALNNFPSPLRPSLSLRYDASEPSQKSSQSLWSVSSPRHFEAVWLVVLRQELGKELWAAMWS